MTFECSKRSDWFCVLCSCYVYIKNRIKFNDIIKNRILRAYNRLPINYEQSYCPKIVCRTCHNDLQRHLNQMKPLRYTKAAIWNSPLPDHSNCFMCLFTVHKYNRIAKRLFGYASNTNLVEPVQNSDFNDKLNNFENLTKLDEQREEMALKNQLNDLLNHVVDHKTYEFNKKVATKDNQINYLNHLNLANRINDEMNSSQTKRANEDDDEISFVGEVKKLKNETNQQSNLRIDKIKKTNNQTNMNNDARLGTFDRPIMNRLAIKEESQNKDLTICHDIEVKRFHVKQVTGDPLSNQEKNAYDLSSGVHQGSFRIEKGIDMLTYFGKKFKNNRQVQKTSRNEFEDLISMLDISEQSAAILETFFERKNYFVWF